MLSVGKAEFQCQKLNREWTRSPKPCEGNLFYIDIKFEFSSFTLIITWPSLRAKSVEFLYGVTFVIFSCNTNHNIYITLLLLLLPCHQKVNVISNFSIYNFSLFCGILPPRHFPCHHTWPSILLPLILTSNCGNFFLCVA